jgi:alginate O-acetyltransferase complex protein AlgI
MTFTSWQFGVFAATVFAAYYLPALRSFQVQLLVVASLFFYGYGQPELLALLAVAVFGTYLFLVLALRNRQVWLPAGIAFNLALLAFFKYKLLFIDPASPSLVDFAPLDFLLKLPLPIGISFFVFHNISLLVDLTRQKAAPPTLAGVFLHHLLSAARFRPDHPRGNVHAADQAEIFRGHSLRRSREMDPCGVFLQALCGEQPQ